MRIMRFLHPSEPGEPADKPPVPDSAPPGDKPPETKPPEEETDEGSDLFGLDDEGEGDEAPPENEPEKAAAASKPEGDEPAKNEPKPEPAKVEPEPEQPPAQPSPKQFYAQVTKLAKSEVEAQFGEKFDEFNPAHVVALQSVSRDIIDDYRNDQRVKEKARQADREASKIITSEALKKFAAEQFENLSYRKAMELRAAESEGNFGPILDFFKDCSKRFEEKAGIKKKADAKVAEVKGRRTAPPPPPLEGAGAGTSGTESERDDDTLSLFGFGG